jgi:hypothetical protein
MTDFSATPYGKPCDVRIQLSTEAIGHLLDHWFAVLRARTALQHQPALMDRDAKVTQLGTPSAAQSGGGQVTHFLSMG